MEEKIIIAIISSGAIFTFIQFLITRHDKKNDKLDDVMKSINSKFDEIKSGLKKIEKGLNATLKHDLTDMIEKYKKEGKTYLADEEFNYLSIRYEECGDGNLESMRKQWGKIPFVYERKKKEDKDE